MNKKLLALIALRAMAQLYALTGNQAQSATMLKLAAIVESGSDVDEHMQLVADGLAAGDATDWDELQARIVSAGEELQSRA